ncbi:MAG TPA: flippase activity-associated protein Agl23, partial [Candidatus Polarisedimenticolia bacterium]|nr:flippase activity-associated protein Agl23 [Candidatus Polarisedimenticolia bacterium]
MADGRGAPDDSGRRRLDCLVSWILAVAAGAPRLVGLGLRPLHHDEGTNWIFLLRLLREGIYQYDPANYHGPLFYYLGILPLALFRPTPATLRIVPALLGTALAPLAWCLRGEIGRTGALAAGLLLAFSPSLVYYSRDAIHEIELVFLTLLLAVAVLRALRSGRGVWWTVAGVAAGGIVATK